MKTILRKRLLFGDTFLGEINQTVSLYSGQIGLFDGVLHSGVHHQLSSGASSSETR